MVQFYDSGVYDSSRCSSSQLNHAMVVTGYGTSSEGKDYWLVKNRQVHIIEYTATRLRHYSLSQSYVLQFCCFVLATERIGVNRATLEWPEASTTSAVLLQMLPTQLSSANFQILLFRTSFKSGNHIIFGLS